MSSTRTYLAIGLAVLMLASAAGTGLAASPAEQGNQSGENETEAGGPPADVGNGSAGPPADAGDENETDENETEMDENESGERGPPAEAGDENRTAGPPVNPDNGSAGPPADAGPNGSLPAVANAPPHDLDGDGKVEDVNGNNRTDVGDVVTYFRHMDDAAIANNTESYDYTENGRIDIADVVDLFGQV